MLENTAIDLKQSVTTYIIQFLQSFVVFIIGNLFSLAVQMMNNIDMYLNSAHITIVFYLKQFFQVVMRKIVFYGTCIDDSLNNWLFQVSIPLYNEETAWNPLPRSRNTDTSDIQFYCR